jgi:hypothetical protein
MAIVKAPALSLEASGNLGGINYTRWKGRAVARSSWTPTIPNTILQQGIQNALSQAVINWTVVLTQIQRDQWNEYAKMQTTIDRLGDVRTPLGYNLYIGRSIQAFRLGIGILLEPPTVSIDSAAARLSISLEIPVTEIRWVLENWVTTARPDRGEYWLAGPYDSEARHATSEEWRFIQYAVPPLEAEFVAVDGKWYWCRGRTAELDGRTGNWLQGHIEAVF